MGFEGFNYPAYILRFSKKTNVKSTFDYATSTQFFHIRNINVASLIGMPGILSQDSTF